MSKTLENARKGNPDAMQALYASHRKTAMYLARLLVQDENAACSAVCKAFRSLWEEVLAGKFYQEEDFTVSLIWKLACQCRAHLAKQDPKALRHPANRAFVLTPDPEMLDITGDAAEIAVNNLPAFQRFISVLCGVHNYSPQQLSQLMHANPATIQMVLDAQQRNYDRILAAASEKMNTSMEMSPEEIHNQLAAKAEIAEVPGIVNATVMIGIDCLCEPLLQKKKAKQARVIQVAILILIACTLVTSILLAVIYWSESSQADTDSTASAYIITQEETWGSL